MAKASKHEPTRAFLRFALLAGVLAVLAGLLGMHVLAGAQGAHASTGYSAVEAQAAVAASSHAASVHGASAHSAPSSGTAAHYVTTTPPSCICSGDCREQHAAHASCTPAPSGASLSAPLPGTTLLAVRPRSATEVDQLPAYSYLPSTPTPNELSISRT